MESFDLAKDYFLSGLDFLEKKEFGKAEDALERSLELIPDRVSTLTNLAAVKIKLEKYEEAGKLANRVLTLDLSNTEAFLNLGIIEVKKGALQKAIEQFNSALQINPDYIEALHNKGLALAGLQGYDESLNCYKKALKLGPNNSEILINMGLALTAQGKTQNALDCFNAAIELEAESAIAFFYKGAALLEMNQYPAGLIAFEKAYLLKPDIDLLLGHLIHSKLLIADWENLELKIELLIRNINSNKFSCAPFGLLSILDSPQLQLKCAKTWVQNECPTNPKLGAAPILKLNKIRIGYFSADFRDHPVTFLTAELFQLHNREKFEIYAFSLNKIPATEPIKMRLKNSFDYFYDIQELSDLAVVQLTRKLGIQIAVDLGGHTMHARTGIFALRAAPLQINFLGYPGTMGADYMDYIIADKTTIPSENKAFFAEKIVYLPNAYLTDDSKRVPAGKSISKIQFGLPVDKFIFCCFNNSYKFNPPTISSWARILLKTPNSILWLSKNNVDFQMNIVNQFLQRGVEAHRIFFADHVNSIGEHLDRISLADLFLDTSPFNAHTTALDSLKAGVPLITLIGNTFAGRVAASILNSIGLPELITESIEQYELLAIDLAANPTKLLMIKQKLAENRQTMPLFNCELFKGHIEEAYIQIHNRLQNNLPPEDLYIL